MILSISQIRDLCSLCLNSFEWFLMKSNRSFSTPQSAWYFWTFRNICMNYEVINLCRAVHKLVNSWMSIVEWPIYFVSCVSKCSCEIYVLRKCVYFQLKCEYLHSPVWKQWNMINRIVCVLASSRIKWRNSVHKLLKHVMWLFSAFH